MSDPLDGETQRGDEEFSPEEAVSEEVIEPEEAAMAISDDGDASAEEAAADQEPVLSDVLGATAKELDDYLDALRRTQADFENYRKRVLKQQAEQADRAAESVVRSLLPVLDILDLALAHISGLDVGGEDAPAESAALSQVGTALLEALGKEGLERLGAQGETFDPAQHEAVIHEAAEDPGEPEVIEVLRSGWRWRSRVLRPAMVKVKG